MKITSTLKKSLYWKEQMQDDAVKDKSITQAFLVIAE